MAPKVRPIMAPMLKIRQRQVSVPLVVNVYMNGKFETLFVASVD